MRFRPLLIASLIACGAASPASGAPCVGFTDVSDGDAAVCSAVEWLKNRSITLGCTSTSEFCPDDTVVRKHMALFMQRLGKALTPAVLHDSSNFINTSVPGTFPGKLACETQDYAVVGFPRTARFHGLFWGQPSGTTASFQGYFLVSTDAGATWSLISSVNDQVVSRVTAASGQYNGSAVLAPPLALSPGTTYRFALFVDGVGTNYAFTQLVCDMEVTVQNANPGTSPLDE